MPFLSWSEGDVMRRFEVSDPVRLGRDPKTCSVAQPTDPSVSRSHALLSHIGGRWWVKDLESRNGTLVNGLAVSTPIGAALQDGDRLALGDWNLTFTERFPGLDGAHFIEGVGDLFSEVRPEPGQILVLLRAVELLQRSSEALLQEGSSEVLFRGILAQGIKLLGADRGFVILVNPDGTIRDLHQVGDVGSRQGLSHSVVDYVLRHRFALLSNAPAEDPRFCGQSLAELATGTLMCAPLEAQGEILGVLYLDRAAQTRPFSRFDLALLQAFVRQGAMILRHTELVQGAMNQAEVQGEYFRLKAHHDGVVQRVGEILGAMRSTLRWIQGYAEVGYGDLAATLRHEASRLHHLVDEGLQEALLEGPKEKPGPASLKELQQGWEPGCRGLLQLRSIPLDLDPAPQGTVYLSGNLAAQALLGLVEPLLMAVPEGGPVTGRWSEQETTWELRLDFPPGLPIPTPDPWTLRALQESGIRWRWSEPGLTLDLPKRVPVAPDTRPFLGLVSADEEMARLFRSVAATEELELRVLQSEPPCAQEQPYQYLVVDGPGTPDPVQAVDAYRRHPGFATVAILVVRARDEQVPRLLAAGATDCLPEGFRWEALHHRLQVLRGHDELLRKARAAERLDSLRKMAGTLKHEINNPLAVISMQIELLGRKYPEEPKLQKIMEMVERIEGLVQVLQKMREASTEDYPGGESILKLG